jgi:hypothetical protein
MSETNMSEFGGAIFTELATATSFDSNSLPIHLAAYYRKYIVDKGVGFVQADLARWGAGGPERNRPMMYLAPSCRRYDNPFPRQFD